MVSPAAAVAGPKVLVVDDDPAIVDTFRMCLESAGCRVATARTADAALAWLDNAVHDVCLLDLGLGDDHDLELLRSIRAAAPWMRVVIVTGNAGVDSAVAAMRAGASDYLVKPCSTDQLALAVDQQVRMRRLETRLEELERTSPSDPEAELHSEDHAFVKVLEVARQVADTDASVLILGESGTGKGVVARAIHAWSRRRAAAFVTVSCPSLSPGLVESELFGHKKGAFTGATDTTLGRVMHADGGTMFLDEIGDFPLVLQPKLLRFIQDREFERVGDPLTYRANVRIVSATNHDLAAKAQAGTFREDLLFRLNVITLELPPLRDRPEDLMRIAQRFLERFAKAYQRPAARFSPEAVAAMRSYRWPGNIRELRNVVERAAILCADPEVGVGQLAIDTTLPQHVPAARVGGDVTIEELERAHIAAIIGAGLPPDTAARALGIDVATLKRRHAELL